MQGRTGDFARINHILDAISEVEKYSENRNFDNFLNDSMFRFACIKQLEIIGEASNHVSAKTKRNFSEIEWQQIVGMRNVFIHEYFGIDLYIVWDIIANDIPELKMKLIEILENMS